MVKQNCDTLQKVGAFLQGGGAGAFDCCLGQVWLLFDLPRPETSRSPATVMYHM